MSDIVPAGATGDDGAPVDPELDLALMHVLRVRGVVTRNALNEALPERGEAAIDAALAVFAKTRLVREWTGRLAGWKLTPEGVARSSMLIQDEVDQAGVRDAIDAVYQRFLPVNEQFLWLCTQWQTRTVAGMQVVNDHRDAEYDAHKVYVLGEVHRIIDGLLDDLAVSLDRFAAYAPRFENALANVRGGLQDWFTAPGIDSFHTVWFELHEDLLATLGRTRSQESNERRLAAPHHPEVD